MLAVAHAYLLNPPAQAFLGPSVRPVAAEAVLACVLDDLRLVDLVDHAFVVPLGSTLFVFALFLEDHLGVWDVIDGLVVRLPFKLALVLFEQLLQRPVLGLLAVLEAHEVPSLVSEQLDVVENILGEPLAQLLQGSLAVPIIQDDLLVLGAILELVPFLNIEVVPIVLELREATSDEV